MKQEGIGRRQPRLANRLAIAATQRDLAPRLLQPAALAIPDVALVETWRIDDPELRPFLVQQPDQRRPGRQSAGEGPRAVDRVEAPAPGAAAGRIAEFLAGNSVVGKALGDQGAHRLLG